jgi:hypothetical protein
MKKAVAMALIANQSKNFVAGKPWGSARRGKKQNKSILSGSNFIAKGI